MTDVHEPQVRSFNMSKIRAKNTKPEILVRKFLHAKGLRFKLHDKSLPGSPDIVLPKYKTVIQVNGCFWHGHSGCKYFVIPKTRTDWWKAKINKTISNDFKNKSELENLGWFVLNIWECELKNNRKEETLEKVLSAVNEQPK